MVNEKRANKTIHQLIVLLCIVLIGWWHWDAPEPGEDLASIRALFTAALVLALIYWFVGHIGVVQDMPLARRLRQRARAFQVGSIALFLVAAGVLVGGGYVYVEVGETLYDESSMSATNLIKAEGESFDLTDRRRALGVTIRDDARKRVVELKRSVEVAERKYRNETLKFDEHAALAAEIGILTASKERADAESWLLARREEKEALEKYGETLDPKKEMEFARDATAARKKMEEYRTPAVAKLLEEAEARVQEVQEKRRAQVDEAQEQLKDAEQALMVREKILEELEAKALLAKIGADQSGDGSAPQVDVGLTVSDDQLRNIDPWFQLTITRIGLTLFTLLLVQTIVSLQKYASRLAVYYSARADTLDLFASNDPSATQLGRLLGLSEKMEWDACRQIDVLDLLNPRHITFQREVTLPDQVVAVARAAVDVVGPRNQIKPG